jgi:hypothetical protein
MVLVKVVVIGKHKKGGALRRLFYAVEAIHELPLLIRIGNRRLLAEKSLRNRQFVR